MKQVGDGDINLEDGKLTEEEAQTWSKEFLTNNTTKKEDDNTAKDWQKNYGKLKNTHPQFAQIKTQIDALIVKKLQKMTSIPKYGTIYKKNTNKHWVWMKLQVLGCQNLKVYMVELMQTTLLQKITQCLISQIP